MATAVQGAENGALGVGRPSGTQAHSFMILGLNPQRPDLQVPSPADPAPLRAEGAASGSVWGQDAGGALWTRGGWRGHRGWGPPPAAGTWGLWSQPLSSGSSSLPSENNPPHSHKAPPPLSPGPVQRHTQRPAKYCHSRPTTQSQVFTRGPPGGKAGEGEQDKADARERLCSQTGCSREGGCGCRT